jgi:KDO2-lipid IV(A) lauroyltransferase
MTLSDSASRPPQTAPPPAAGGEPAPPELKHDPGRWRAKSLNAAIFFRMIHEVAAHIPEELTEDVGEVIAHWIGHLVPPVIEALKRNCRVVRPGLSAAEYEVIARRTIVTYGLGIKDYLLKGAGRLSHFEIEGAPPPPMRALIDARKGFLLVSAHFGNFEMGSAMMQRYNVPGTVVALPEDVAEIDRMRVDNRRMHGAETLVVGSDLDTLIKAKRDLASGHALAMLVERHLPKNALPVQFFGRTCYFLRTPALLARHSGAPLIPVAIIRTGRSRYRMHSGDPIRVAGTREEAGLIAATQQVADFFAEFIRKHPDHWFNFYDYFAAATKPV